MCFKAKQFDIDLPVDPPKGIAVSSAGKKRTKASSNPVKQHRNDLPAVPPSKNRSKSSSKSINAWFKRVGKHIRGPSSKDKQAMMEKIQKIQIGSSVREEYPVIDIRSPAQRESSMLITPVIEIYSPELHLTPDADAYSDAVSDLESPSIYSCDSGRSSDFTELSPSLEYVTAESSPVEDQGDSQVTSISNDTLIEADRALRSPRFSDSSSDSSASMASLSDFQTPSAGEIDVFEAPVKVEDTGAEAFGLFPGSTFADGIQDVERDAGCDICESTSKCQGPTVRLIPSEPAIIEVRRSTGLQVVDSFTDIQAPKAERKVVRFTPVDLVAIIPREPPTHELSYIVPYKDMDQHVASISEPFATGRDVSSQVRTLLKPSSLYDPLSCPSPIIGSKQQQRHRPQSVGGRLPLPISPTFSPVPPNHPGSPIVSSGSFGEAVVDDDLIAPIKRRAVAFTPNRAALPEVPKRIRDLSVFRDDHPQMVLRRAAAVIMEERQKLESNLTSDPFPIPSSPVERRKSDRLPTIHHLRHSVLDCPCIKKIAKRRQRGPTLFCPSDLSNWDIIERAEPEEEIQQPRYSKPRSSLKLYHLSTERFSELRKYEIEKNSASVNSNIVSISPAAEVDPLVISGVSVSSRIVSQPSVSSRHVSSFSRSVSSESVSSVSSGPVSPRLLSSISPSLSSGPISSGPVSSGPVSSGPVSSCLSSLDPTLDYVISARNVLSLSDSGNAISVSPQPSKNINSKNKNRSARICQPTVSHEDLDDFGVSSTRVSPKAISRKAHRSARILTPSSGLGIDSDSSSSGSVNFPSDARQKALMETYGALERRSANVKSRDLQSLLPTSPQSGDRPSIVSSVSAPEFSSNQSHPLSSSDCDKAARHELPPLGLRTPQLPKYPTSRRAAIYITFNSPRPAEPQSPVPALPPHLVFPTPIRRSSDGFI